MIEPHTIFSATILCTLVILLSVAVIVDLRDHRIPNVLLAPALSLALMSNTLYAGGEGLLLALSGFLLGLLMFLPLYVIGGMGAGDVKLLGVVGSLLGPAGAVIAGIAAMMAGGVFGLIAIVWRRVRPRLDMHAVQFSNLGVGGMSADSYLDASDGQQRLVHIAYAPAIAAGTAVSLWYLGYLPELNIG